MLRGSAARSAAGFSLEHFPPMIEALKSDEIVEKMGGRFKLTAVIQRRLKVLIIGCARPLVERQGRTYLELVIEVILQSKIGTDWSETGYQPPKLKKR